MEDHSDDFDMLDPADLKVDAFNVKSAVFLIPSDAPIPSELSDVSVPEGSLLARLAPTDDPEPDGMAFVPISGSELIALDRSWRLLTRAPKVFALFGLPGARYDVLFTQAVRQIGIGTIEWASVAQAIADRTRQVQRTRDSAAWQVSGALSDAPRRSAHSSKQLDREPLPTPESTDEDTP